MQQIRNVITNMSAEKRSKEERRELMHKLESMEEKEDSPEDIEVMPNSCIEQSPLEQFEEVTARDFDEAMM